MRAIVAAGMLLAGIVGVDAAPVGGYIGTPTFQGAGAETVQDSYCGRLRRGCINREEWGEVGQGNCRRYRQECGGGRSYCQRLREACIYKEERGEVGEGNCRRYRRECQ